MTRWIARQSSSRYRHWFQNRNHVFRHAGPFAAVDDGRCRIEAYREEAAVPAAVTAVVKKHGGERAVSIDRMEMADGAVLWAAYIGDDVTGTSMSRKGRYFQSWFVPLEDEDIVIFRNRTFPGHRGKGICPMLMRHIMYTVLGEGGSAYVDCRVYNKASIRSIEKAGFERIATMKPILSCEALRAS